MGDLTYSPTSNLVKTILGVKLELEKYTGVTPTYDTNATLDRKYNVFPDLVPTASPTVAYFGIGIKGRRTIDDGFITAPVGVRSTNLDLYGPIPFRCVPIEEDLSAEERSSYRMRVRKTFNGNDYYAYYLKKILLTDNVVRMTKKNPISGTEEPFSIDYSELSPTPPQITPNGITSDSNNEINTTVSLSLPLTGSEVVESVGTIFGNLQQAVISEIGIYSGEDRLVTGMDYTNTPFNYTELVLASLVSHYTFNGHDMSRPEAVFGYGFRWGSGDIITT